MTNSRRDDDKEKAKELSKIFSEGLIPLPTLPDTPTQTDIPQPEPDYSFDETVANNLRPGVNWILEKLMTPWLIRVMRTYREWEFHEKMKGFYFYQGGWYKGHNFIGDWNYNHKKVFKLFIFVARRNKRTLNFDIDVQLNRLTRVMTEMYGWKILPEEKQSLRQVFQFLHQMIYDQ